MERVHRTVKRVAARSRISPPEAAFWYNLAPSCRNPDSAPSSVLFSSGYRWRNPGMVVPGNARVDDIGQFKVGDSVFVKPSIPRCTTQWPVGQVTAILSNQAIEVDGVPRHVADCRITGRDPQEVGGSDRGETSDEETSEDDADLSSLEESVISNPWQGRLRQNINPPDRYVPS